MRQALEADSDPDLFAVWQWFELQSQLIASERRRFQLVLSGRMSADDLDSNLRAQLFGLNESEIIDSFEAQRTQLERLTMLALFTTAEAILRMDYEQRAKLKLKDSISRKYRKIWLRCKRRARLNEDLLEALKDEVSPPSIVREFRAAQKLRHWLAHGRWWNPKLGRDYLPSDILNISRAIIEALSS